MSRSEVIAEVALQVTDHGEPPRECGVKVYRPARTREREWVCSVELEGLESHPVQIRGEDSLQALTLALEFVRKHLEGCRARGGRVLLPSSGEERPLDTYFPQSSVRDPED